MKTALVRHTSAVPYREKQFKFVKSHPKSSASSRCCLRNISTHQRTAHAGATGDRQNATRARGPDRIGHQRVVLEDLQCRHRPGKCNASTELQPTGRQCPQPPVNDPNLVGIAQVSGRTLRNPPRQVERPCAPPTRNALTSASTWSAATATIAAENRPASRSMPNTIGDSASPRSSPE